VKTLLKAVLWLGVALVVVAAGVLGYAWHVTDKQLAVTYSVDDAPLAIATDAATLDRGRHLFAELGCSHCHGARGEGQMLADVPPFKFVAPNITPATIAGRYDADRLAAAIRHGVKPDGTPLRMMPTGDFHNLTDADVSAVIAHVQALPPSPNDPGQFELKPLGRVLAMLGKIDLTPAAGIDHAPRTRTSPPMGPTAEYGAYLAQRCVGCHGTDFSGGHVPGTPPDFPDAANLTPHAQGLGAWTLADFQAALRTGKRPDGRVLDEFMPWKAYGSMSDDEVAALYAYLRTVPAKAPAK
jgi:cytochrome c553